MVRSIVGYLRADHANRCAFPVVCKADKYDAHPFGPVRKRENELERLDARLFGVEKFAKASLKVADGGTRSDVGEEVSAGDVAVAHMGQRAFVRVVLEDFSRSVDDDHAERRGIQTSALRRSWILSRSYAWKALNLRAPGAGEER